MLQKRTLTGCSGSHFKRKFQAVYKKTLAKVKLNYFSCVPLLDLQSLNIHHWGKWMSEGDRTPYMATFRGKIPVIEVTLLWNEFFFLLDFLSALNPNTALPGEWHFWIQEWSEDGSSAFFSCFIRCFYMQKAFEIPSSSLCSFIDNRQVLGSDEIYQSCLIAMWQCACVCVWKQVCVFFLGGGVGGHKVFSSLLEPNITMMTRMHHGNIMLTLVNGPCIEKSFNSRG